MKVKVKVRFWLVTLDRSAWVSGAEILGLSLILLAGPPWPVRLLVGLPLLAHLGYNALTSLPLGMIPRRPDDARGHRRNQDLRSRVVGFLNDIRNIEAYAQRAAIGDLPRTEVEVTLRKAQRQMSRAAAEMVTVMGRSTLPPDHDEEVPGERGENSRIRVKPRDEAFDRLSLERPVSVTRGLRLPTS